MGLSLKIRATQNQSMLEQGPLDVYSCIKPKEKGVQIGLFGNCTLYTARGQEHRREPALSLTFVSGKRAAVSWPGAADPP